jgi:DNA-binding MarR family transcriptional regulator
MPRRRRLVALTQDVIIIIVKIMSISRLGPRPAHRNTGGAGRLPRYRPATFKLGDDAVPIRKVPAPLARLFQQICTSIIAEALAGTDIVQLEFVALSYISDVPGIEQWQLAETIGIDRNSASLLADQLEKKGLAERRIDATDRRARKLYLTTNGERTIGKLRPKVRAGNERILVPLLPSERTLLIELLVKLIEGNRKHARPGAGRRKRGSAVSPAC